MLHPRDKEGREIMPGDTLKVFHFTGARRKRHYMYKHVLRVEKNCLVISHLAVDPKSTYIVLMDGAQHKDYEIVQGYQGLPKDGLSFKDRPIINTPQPT